VNVIVEARHFKARETLRESTEKEVRRLEKYFNRITRIEVTLDGMLDKKESTVKVHVPDQTLIATETADKFEIAVEATVDKLVPQLKKYKNKLKKR
jgi:putative sigma-54 modulation protein